MVAILIKYDEAIAQRCFNFMEPRIKLRRFLKTFEYIYHGVPWFLIVILMYFGGNHYLSSIALVIFKGKKETNFKVIN